MIDGKFKVIDAHCHIYPEKIASKAVHGTDTFYDIVSYGKGTIGDMFFEGNIAGIDKYVVQSVATTPHQVLSINEFIAGQVNIYPDKLTGLGTLHPDSQDIAGDLKHLISLGLHGVKLHPDIQRFDVDDKRCLKIYELCERFEVPLLVHTGDNRYDHSNPNRVKPMLKAYPKMVFVGAHFGGWSIWETAWKEYKEFENFYVDCSSSFYHLNDREKAKQLIRNYGADKVLFGTDYPMWRAKTELDYLMSLGLTEEEYQKILYSNAVKVFKVK